MKKLMSLIILASLGFACTDDDIRSEHVLNEGPKIVGFAKSTVNMAYFEHIGPVEDQGVKVALIGRGNGDYPTSSINMTYEVDLVASTAIEGREFNFVDDTHKITIPAGGSFVTLPITVNTDNLDPDKKTELILKLVDTSDSVIGAQYNTVKVVFVGCPTNLEGDYIWGGAYPVTITKIAPNVYEGDFVPYLNFYWWQFSDVCTELEIVDWEYQASNAMTGANGGPVKGKVEANGDLTFNNVTIGGVASHVNKTWVIVRQ